MTPQDEAAAKEVQNLYDRLDDKDEPLGQADSYAEDQITGTKYLLAGNGPTIWFYLVKDSAGQEEFGVVEYIDAYGTGYAIVPQHQAEVIDLALRSR